MKRMAVLAVAAMFLGACKGDPGPAGPAGAQGTQGAQGAKGDPGPVGPMPDVSFVGRLLEAEGPVNASATVGATAADITASGGNVRFAAGSGSAGTVYAIANSDLGGGKLGVGRTEVTVRAKVTSNLSTSVLAQIHCEATRAGDTSPTTVSALLDIRPNEFVSSQWRELTIRCDFLPNDANQSVVVGGFVAGITDLSLDYVRITPLSSATRLLGRAGCNNCAGTLETFAAYKVAKASGNPVEATVTTSGGPVLVLMTIGVNLNSVVGFWCSIRVRDSGGAYIKSADLSGSNTPSGTNLSCSGSYIFDLPAGRYTFEADGWTAQSVQVNWVYDRQISVWEL